MEVGAVKQAFNNEVILLKKKLNQTKLQIIHKLTRKAKTLAEKKAPDKLKEKQQRKAVNAVNEVLIIKKIKAKDIAKFIVTHKGELKDFLNRPIVDESKACARLLLHKTMQDKYKFIRGRFSNVPINDLFMSRLERRKMKKDAKEKQKNKKKAKEANLITSEGDWDVEDVGIDINDNSKNVNDDIHSENELSDGDNDELEKENMSDDGLIQTGDKNSESDNSDHMDIEQVDEIKNNDSSENKTQKKLDKNEINILKVTPIIKENTVVDTKQKKLNTNQIIGKKGSEKKVSISEEHKNITKKHKDANKNKNFNEKLMQRKFKKNSDKPALENKIIDPFFITSTGENYMSVVEPRQPDEVKEVHKEGNRKLRRAALFGYVPKIKPRSGKRFDTQNCFNRESDNNKFNIKKMEFDDDRKSKFNVKSDSYKVEKEEKLHPSWEAKKKKSGILPFEGKKIVFDDS